MQKLRALIDINQVDLVVPSVNCTTCSHMWRYNSSMSSSYEANGTELELEGGKGFVGLDTFTVSDDVEVPRQRFLEASYVSFRFSEFRPVDTVLGLAINEPLSGDRTNHLNQHLPGLFPTMKQAGVVDQSIISMLLPRDGADVGEILFGDINHNLYQGPLSKHPLFPPDTSTWQIEGSSAAIVHQNGTLLFEERFPRYSARFHTAYPFTELPPAIAEALINATGADCSDSCHGCEVPCDAIPNLPNIIFNLGGHNISLAGDDYTIKSDIVWPFCKNRSYCTLLFYPGINVHEKKVIELGSSFLRGVYSAYDLDSRSIFCKYGIVQVVSY